MGQNRPSLSTFCLARGSTVLCPSFRSQAAVSRVVLLLWPLFRFVLPSKSKQTPSWGLYGGLGTKWKSFQERRGEDARQGQHAPLLSRQGFTKMTTHLLHYCPLKGTALRDTKRFCLFHFFLSQCECQGSNPRPLKEQQVLLTTDLFTIDNIFLWTATILIFTVLFFMTRGCLKLILYIKSYIPKKGYILFSVALLVQILHKTSKSHLYFSCNR